MSLVTKTLFAAAATVMLVGVAVADDAGPWVLKSDMGYGVDKNGNTVLIDLHTMNKTAMAKAKPVAAGTVFFMQNGRLVRMEPEA